MNREQMIETVDSLLGDWDATASDIVDAILPQVTTVEEWEALPMGTVLVDSEGMPYAKDYTPSSDLLISWHAAPLTVVWQPWL